jgi:hypothetical protein
MVLIAKGKFKKIGISAYIVVPKNLWTDSSFPLNLGDKITLFVENDKVIAIKDKEAVNDGRTTQN